MHEEWIRRAETYIANTYKRYPIVATRGEGCWLWDSNGRRYLDFISGISVCNLGHSHSRIVSALQNQLSRLLHVSNLFYIEEQIKAAELLVELSFGDKVFFCNSGAEAVEAAIKLARRYSWKKYGPGRYEIIAMEGSFHGRTLGALSATGQKVFHEGFEPLLQGFRFVPFNDVQAFKQALDEKVCACIMEVVQSEGGVHVATKEFLKAVREETSERDILLIFDEAQTGIGRTGKLFAYEHTGFEPDLMTLAKALGNGFPVGALVGKKAFMDAFEPGTHASTFGGNPLASSAIIATLSAISEEHILEHCEKMGLYLRERLEGLMTSYPMIKEIRGIGLLLGLELKGKAEWVREALLREGILVNCTKTEVIRILPPLNVGEEEVDLFLHTLENVLKRL